MNRKGNKKVRAHKKKNGYALIYDIIVIALGIAAAIILVKFGIIDAVVNALSGYTIFAVFFAGIFFTSTFTIAPASVALAHLATHVPLPTLALWGALGAMCGDLVLFFFIKDRFADDLMSVIKPSRVKHFFHSLHFGFLKWLSPLVGALIIASPIPDEFGISLLGISKVKLSLFMPLTFVMNFLGILALVGVANLFS